MEGDEVDGIFGPVLSRYSRQQAIEDGVLVDVSAMAREAGFAYPVALTSAVHSAYVRVPRGVRGQDEAGRLWDILWMMRVNLRSLAPGTCEFLFKLHVRNDNRERTPPLRTLKAVCGPGDELEPVITVMMPDED